jgi:2'-5' RNA ligase
MGGVRPAAGRGGSAGQDERLRLFVAVLLPEAWLSDLAADQETLRRAGLRLRYVRPEGIHLTLKFLGETRAHLVPRILAVLAGVAARAAPCSLELGACGVFGSTRRPRVVWRAVAGDRACLSALARSVDEALAGVGFAREARPFNPHLTLARVPEDLSPADAARIAPAVQALGGLSAAAFRLERLSLMQSVLGPGGAEYTELDSWTFRGPSET